MLEFDKMFYLIDSKIVSADVIKPMILFLIIGNKVVYFVSIFYSA